VYGSRDLTEFELDLQFSNDVLVFVPDGSQAPSERAVTETTNCNNCHDPLSAHGELRRDVRLCVLCHTPQTVDPDTENTTDFKVMIHKIHRGSSLPSVQAGTPYRIIGFRQSVHDYSNVTFPDDVRNCERCHKNAPQSTNYLTKPSRGACGSCHDNVDFASGENHAGIAQASDALCSTCHLPQGELEFDVSIKGAHVVPIDSQSLPGVVFDILAVENGGAGKRPTVRFSLRDKAGKPIAPADMSSLSLVMAGPTTDYTAYVRENARGATGSGGEYFYTFTRAIAEDFKGSMVVGIEGYQNRTLMKSDGSMISVRDAGLNKTFYFDTGGGKTEPRRQIVKLDGCNSCHGELKVHGGQRDNTEYCVLCHTPFETDAARRPADKMPPETVNFKMLIHRIHAGEKQTRDVTVYGFGGAPFNINHILFPGDARNCVKCHIEGSQQLPLAENLQPTVTPRDLLNPMPPETSACLACHTTRAAAVHAQLNSSPLGEACAVCHGPKAEFSVDRVHAR
jgi:OmcA/MtrC family decaheme c-type cytochrome